MQAILFVLGVVVAWLIITVLAALLGGVIIQDAWGWFIEPLGAPAIGLAHAIGLSMLVGYFKMKVPKADEPKQDTAERVGSLLGAFLMMLMSWGMMAIAASFM